MSDSFYVLVGICHEAYPDVFSVFLWDKYKVVTPLRWFFPYTFNDYPFPPIYRTFHQICL